MPVTIHRVFGVVITSSLRCFVFESIVTSFLAQAMRLTGQQDSGAGFRLHNFTGLSARDLIPYFTLSVGYNWNS